MGTVCRQMPWEEEQVQVVNFVGIPCRPRLSFHFEDIFKRLSEWIEMPGSSRGMICGDEKKSGRWTAYGKLTGKGLASFCSGIVW
mmetsp:Transcript_9555/g.18012  ORF Transcript_9555/g.18012 Transcript_9555/m.18012 type:complete len:85 (-) Transcript_9555:154-408(-)